MIRLVKMSESTEVARPLKVLISLIKEDLANGNEAAEKAGMPYYRAAGEKLLEAKPTVTKSGERWDKWVKRNFGISHDQAGRYMKFALATSNRQNTLISEEYKTLDDFRERHLGEKVVGTGRVHREWREDVDKLAERARQAEARLKEENLTREQEREAKRKLAERLIDIGYKVLAKELHPDKGGSKDAIQRLHEVRAELKGHRFN